MVTDSKSTALCKTEQELDEALRRELKRQLDRLLEPLGAWLQDDPPGRAEKPSDAPRPPGPESAKRT